MTWIRNALFCTGVLALFGCPSALYAAEPAKPTFAKDIAPLIKQYCGKCHGDKKPKGGVNLTAFTDDASVLKKRKVWEQVADNVRSGDMPPLGIVQPVPPITLSVSGT